MQNFATSINASSFGYNPTNATTALQNAIQSQNDTIIVDLQIADWNIGPILFSDLQNKVIIFEKNVKLKAISGVFGIYDSLLEFTNCNNIQLIGYQAEFVMNKPEYVALNNSEFRHCLSLNNCVSISVFGLTFRDSGGDGIYIGGENNAGNLGYCDTIFIEDIKCINNYRQGMSIISVQNMTVKNASFSDTIGTLPEAGIDIEPYLLYHRIVNLNIDNCSFTNNGFAGIAVALVYLNGSSLPVSINIRDCFFRNNCRPGNTYSKSEIYVNADDFNPVQGNVLFERCFIESSNYAAYYSRKTAAAFETKFKDCVFQNVSQLQLPYNNPIFLEVPNYNQSSPSLGGYVFENVFISYQTNFNFFRVFGASTLQGLSNITGNFIVVEPNNNPILYTDVPQQTNVNYTFSNQTSLASTIVSINSSQNEAVECDATLANYTVSRTSSNISYPLGISYAKSGTVIFGDDVHLMTNGLVIPANAISKTETILARKDLFSEANEAISLSIIPSNSYTVSTNSSSNFVVKDCQNLNINEIIISKIKVYPNPVSDFLHIENFENLSIIQITNSLGQIIFTENCSNTKIDFSNFQSGIYFLKLDNSTFKIIKK